MQNNFHTNCIFCGSENLFQMPDFDHAFLVKCKSCLLVFGQKIPSGDELEKHYGNYPRYQNLSPITVKRYNELLDHFEGFRQTGNIIDLGCSNGLFLEIAKQRGWNVFGTEYDPACIENGRLRGVTIYKSNELPEKLFQMKFDVVTSFEVIEHIHSPNQEMELINRLLRNGGALYITTPNFNSVSRFFLQHKWNVIEYPEHLTYYTPYTINQLMKKFNYEKKYLKTTGIALSRLRKSLGFNEPNSLLEKNTDEILREKMEEGGVAGMAKRLINSILNTLKIGDAMKSFYVKN